MASTCLTWWSRVILTPVEEGAYDVMAVTEYVDYETEPDRYIREIEEAMQRFDSRFEGTQRIPRRV